MSVGHTGRDPEIQHAQAEVARAREAVAGHLMDLQQQLSRAFDWREWIRQRPMTALAAAFGLGVLLGSFGGGAHRNNR
jgi:ElaB/YqjD/DUF883 family membrane-anchored ribosome-binding protein